jgi:hypothetical protein
MKDIRPGVQPDDPGTLRRRSEQRSAGEIWASQSGRPDVTGLERNTVRQFQVQGRHHQGAEHSLATQFTSFVAVEERTVVTDGAGSR